MAPRTAELGGEALHEAPVERGRFARRQVVGEDDDRLGDRCERFPPLAEEVAEQALLDVVDVVRAMGDVVVEALEDLRIASQRAADGVLRPPVAIPDGTGELLLELLVMQHRPLRVEDGGVLVAELVADAVAVALELAGGLGHGLREPGQFGVDRAALDEPPRNAEALAVEDQRLADRHAGGDGDALELQHGRVVRPTAAGPVGEIASRAGRSPRRCGRSDPRGMRRAVRCGSFVVVEAVHSVRWAWAAPRRPRRPGPRRPPVSGLAFRRAKRVDVLCCRRGSTALQVR